MSNFDNEYNKIMESLDDNGLSLDNLVDKRIYKVGPYPSSGRYGVYQYSVVKNEDGSIREASFTDSSGESRTIIRSGKDCSGDYGLTKELIASATEATPEEAQEFNKHFSSVSQSIIDSY